MNHIAENVWDTRVYLLLDKRATFVCGPSSTRLSSTAQQQKWSNGICMSLFGFFFARNALTRARLQIARSFHEKTAAVRSFSSELCLASGCPASQHSSTVVDVPNFTITKPNLTLQWTRDQATELFQQLHRLWKCNIIVAPCQHLKRSGASPHSLLALKNVLKWFVCVPDIVFASLEGVAFCRAIQLPLQDAATAVEVLAHLYVQSSVHGFHQVSAVLLSILQKRNCIPYLTRTWLTKTLRTLLEHNQLKEARRLFLSVLRFESLLPSPYVVVLLMKRLWAHEHSLPSIHSVVCRSLQLRTHFRAQDAYLITFYLKCALHSQLLPSPGKEKAANTRADDATAGSPSLSAKFLSLWNQLESILKDARPQSVLSTYNTVLAHCLKRRDSKGVLIVIERLLSRPRLVPSPVTRRIVKQHLNPLPSGSPWDLVRRRWTLFLTQRERKG
ncbi:hypothetical protein SJAG_02577 [Schizosaccharomyces japonicus yFS275]|uniref:Uncharacterized protein n=1 Tax=Schizosaccharomyces japonicus (strain yFS275 / FY16936) TaxID=402676 RepID=B6K0M0_SCHJY|nr:hypothetical protein SJAG_02577 [Schizosaccharomyces japonicus yFS275]EEB07491.1 hypothetical protein SJAG_02577 [Schizosaccharomyces japonicus yFS275]